MGQRLSREEFHRWAEGQSARYERVCSEPVAMAPERIQHVRVKARVWAALDRAIASAGVDCEALSDGVTIEVDDDTDYEPDAIVNCGPPAATIPQPSSLCFPPPSSYHTTPYPSTSHYLSHTPLLPSYLGPNVGMIELEPPGIAIDIAEFYPSQR